MTIGVAIVVVAVMYFIDKHNLWRRAAMCLGVTAAAVLLGLGGFWGWKTHRDTRDAKALTEFNKKWAAEIPACNSRNIKNYFAAAAATSPAHPPGLPPGFELEQSMPQSVMENIKKNCNASPFTYVWPTPWEVAGEECIDGTNPPCTLMSDGHGNLVPIPRTDKTSK